MVSSMRNQLLPPRLLWALSLRQRSIFLSTNDSASIVRHPATLDKLTAGDRPGGLEATKIKRASSQCDKARPIRPLASQTSPKRDFALLVLQQDRFRTHRHRRTFGDGVLIPAQIQIVHVLGRRRVALVSARMPHSLRRIAARAGQTASPDARRSGFRTQ